MEIFLPKNILIFGSNIEADLGKHFFLKESNKNYDKQMASLPVEKIGFLRKHIHFIHDSLQNYTVYR